MINRITTGTNFHLSIQLCTQEPNSTATNKSGSVWRYTIKCRHPFRYHCTI